MAFSPEGSTIALCGNDQTVRIWSASARTLLSTLKGHASVLHSVAYSPDGRAIVSGGDDKTVRIWRAADGAALKSHVGYVGQGCAVADPPDRCSFAAGSMDKTVRIWSPSEGIQCTVLREASSRTMQLFATGMQISDGTVMSKTLQGFLREQGAVHDSDCTE